MSPAALEAGSSHGSGGRGRRRAGGTRDEGGVAGARVLWAVTGAGHLLGECVDAAAGLATSGVEVQPVLSAQGEAVARAYRLFARIHQRPFLPAVVERAPNHPALLGGLYRGRFAAIVVAPASANTVAKLVLGIADALVPNLVAQGMKCGVPVLVLPTDREAGPVETDLPGGGRGRIVVRPVDAANALALGRMEGVSVLAGPEAIAGAVARELGRAAHLNIV